MRYLLATLMFCCQAMSAQTSGSTNGIIVPITSLHVRLMPFPAFSTLAAPDQAPVQQPSLGDLGITAEQAKGNPAEQARLDRRTHMLKIHQRLGIITLAPLIATLIASNSAGERHTGSGRAIHAALGGATVGMYLTTAAFAVFAPKVPHDHLRGGIKWHRRLAYVHAAGMILLPILGAIAYNQVENGEKVHGVGQLHAPVAIITTAAFGAAIASVSLKF